MSLSINNIIYLFGAIISIFSLFISRSKMPSFFSYRRIIQVLRNENQEFDDVLSKLRKWNYSDYDLYIFTLSAIIFIVIFEFGNGKINLYDDFLSLFLVYIVFAIFVSIVDWKRNSLFHKNVDITKSLRKIVDLTYFSDALIVWIVIMFIIIVSVPSFIFNNNVSANLFQIFLLFVVGILIIAYFLFLNAIIIGSIEQNYLIIQKNKHELPEMYVKVKMKNMENQIIGTLDSINLNFIIIEEPDGFRLSLEYNKIDSISVRIKKNE